MPAGFPDLFASGVEAFNSGRTRTARSALLRALLAGGPEAAWACQQWLQTWIQRGQDDRAERELGRRLSPDSSLHAWGLGYLCRRTGRAAPSLRDGEGPIHS